MRTALVFNPASGASLLAESKLPEEEHEKALVQELQGLGFEPEVHYTTIEDPGREIAKQLVCEGFELIIAVGGDGTIHSVAHGLIGSTCTLGIIPAGTMNNLARSLGIPEETKEACAVLSNGEACRIDIGMINQHPFLEVAGIGLEAALFPAAEEVKSRGILSTIRGVMSGLYTLSRFRPPRVKISFDGQKSHVSHAIQVTICNAPYYGTHINLGTGILMNDGWLDVIIYTNFRKREYLLHALSISQGRRPFTPKIIHRRARSLYISTSEVVDIQADGIVYGHTPADVSIVTGALKVMVPRKTAPGLLSPVGEPAAQKANRRKRTYV